VGLIITFTISLASQLLGVAMLPLTQGLTKTGPDADRRAGFSHRYRFDGQACEQRRKPKRAYSVKLDRRAACQHRDGSPLVRRHSFGSETCSVAGRLRPHRLCHQALGNGSAADVQQGG